MHDSFTSPCLMHIMPLSEFRLLSSIGEKNTRHVTLARVVIICTVKINISLSKTSYAK